MEEPTVLVIPAWIHAGAILKGKSPDDGRFWVKEVTSGNPSGVSIVKILRVGLGDTLRMSIAEVYDRFEPTGQRSTLPPRK
jgi:hypothetical protein